MSESGRLVQLRAGGVSYRAVVYWAKDSQGVASLVVAVPMGDLEAQDALAQLAEGTGEELLDHLVRRVAELGAELLPWPDEQPKARVN